MFQMLLRVLASLILLFPYSSWASSVWLSDGTQLYSIDTLSNRATAINIDAPIRAIAAVQSGGAWVLNDKQLIVLPPLGNASLAIELAQLQLREPRLLALDPYDGTLWLVDAQQRVNHLGPNADLILRFQVAEPVLGIALAQDQTLWLASARQVWHYSASGQHLGSFGLSNEFRERPARLAVDSIGSH